MEILNGQESFKEKFGEPLTFTKFYLSIHQKEKVIYFSTDIPDTFCLCEIRQNATLMAKAVRKEKKDHPTTPHDLLEKYLFDSSDANCISNKCREYSLKKILPRWAEASSSESSAERSSSSVEGSDGITHTQWTKEDGKMKKITKHMIK